MDPWSVLQDRGADALRWNFVSASSPWTPKRVSLENIDETTNRFLLTLWNTYSFFVTYAQPRRVGSRGDDRPPGSSDHVLDRWIRSRLHCTVSEVGDALERFDALRAAQALERLVDDLSNWYVRRSRSRFWNANDTDAHAVLHECLLLVTQMLAPFCPFISDAMYQDLAQTTESVHLSDWPTFDAVRDRSHARRPTWRSRARSSRSGSRRAPRSGSRCANRWPARLCSSLARCRSRSRCRPRSPTR